jgi:superfamily II DNA or RNA helicase
VLIFSESVKGIDAVYEYLHRNGVKCGIYHSQIDHQTRDLMLRQWKENVFQVLCAVRCLDEGIDVPECRIGVIVATGTTTKQLIQRIGRLVRKRSDGSRGLLFIVYCAGTVEVGYAQKIRWVIQNE